MICSNQEESEQPRTVIASRIKCISRLARCRHAVDAVSARTAGARGLKRGARPGGVFGSAGPCWPRHVVRQAEGSVVHFLRGGQWTWRGSVQATRRRRAGCLARAGRSCITPACDAKASASSGPHTSSAPSAVKVRLIACIESVQTLKPRTRPPLREQPGSSRGREGAS
jgi:hypothetical protein